MSLKELLNLGPVSVKWLEEIGVHDRASLEAVGAVEAFQLIQSRHAGANLNLLYSLHGALTDTPWDALDLATQVRLKRNVGL